MPSGSSSSGEYAVSAWVGIDGATCQTAIWQAGIDMYIEKGVASYYRKFWKDGVRGEGLIFILS